MPVLNTTVVLRDDSFVTHVFTPGQEPPQWAVDKITNPAVWATAPAQKAANEKPAEKPSTAEPAVKIPPKAGRGSSAKAWSEYAKTQGFEVDGDATATEIREALQEHNIPID